MSRRWEAAIQDWYLKSPTANLEYLDLANTEPTQKELAHNLAVIYDRINLSSKVNLKNFKTIQEEIVDLKAEYKELSKSVRSLIQIATEGKTVALEVLTTSEQLKQKFEKVEVTLGKVDAWVAL